ncbi:hypothetical protein RTM1035_10480 [Roseovarius sp. TM1035]|uniref:Uncharacterized protein n=1 Tax=Roseovarius mucosus TaxID=215743 RepID=A0A1V0RK78_9RHOB|nr:hypothetical protein ROSMUCSMR3_00612 [Roseovarius mucosus]EDM30427.1 hypothetical protein RTM1035_10480 [Roseovarius sp. TM1035]
MVYFVEFTNLKIAEYTTHTGHATFGETQR